MINATLNAANILIVDDQEANIDVLEGYLEMQDFTNIKTTTDPRNVIPLLHSFQPDLLLLDLTMPYLSGFEVMELLKVALPEDSFLPILVLTADITTEAKIKALSGGASDFLTKPFDLLEVGLRIKNLLYSSYLRQQLYNQNRILDEKVKERTQELVRKNTELEIAKEKAEASDRLKTSFINNISHEIRTPLNGILGFGQILMDPALDENEKEEYMTILNQSSERLINTVTNFMEISMVSSGNQEVNKKLFWPETVLNNIVRLFQEACNSKKLNLSLELPSSEKEIQIYSDGELLFKILRHLVDNAVKYTNQGFITIGLEIKNNDFVFFVKDTGTGISKEGKETIFKNFMQEDNSYTRPYEGCGLGLSIASGIVELLGGTIWLDSEKGVGSTFYFSIPIEVESPVAMNVTLYTSNGNKIKCILIAEDDEINFVYLNVLLKSKNTKIIRAFDGLDAISQCKNNPDIDIVLMDLKMPDVDGYSATRQIKLFRKELPVLAVTAFSGSEDKQRAIEAGCDEFITKPVKKDILVEKLANYGILI